MKKKTPSLKSLLAEIAQLKRVAFTDELTGLYNRHGFMELSQKFTSEVLRAKKASKEKRHSFVIKDFSLVLFDLDHFKKINDTYGHDAGDRVLKAFGVLLRERVRDADIVARWGGEEIVVGLTGANEQDAWRIAEQMRLALMKKRFRFGKQSVQVTVSGGVANFIHAKDLKDLFKRADKALYAAKAAGRNVVKIA